MSNLCLEDKLALNKKNIIRGPHKSALSYVTQKQMFVGFAERIILFRKVLQNILYKQDKSLQELKHEKEETLFGYYACIDVHEMSFLCFMFMRRDSK